MNNLKSVFALAAVLYLANYLFRPEIHAAASGTTNVTVEVLVFSGRPNPAWLLQDTNVLPRLKAELRDLPVAFQEEPAEWSRLGFGGFLLRSAEAVGLPAELRIYQGIIKTGRGKAAKYQKDTLGLEQRLIGEAKKQTMPPPVKDAIQTYENTWKSAK